jgi:signal transduction histidine kinase
MKSKPFKSRAIQGDAVSESPPKNRLRPRARIMRTLGQELISNEVVAVIELVKNAYDADATRVLIRFSGPLTPHNGRIDVVDNGHGMSLSTIQTVWLEPATISKKTTQRSEKLQRRYLGEKGIGRFASARLAEELEVFSRRTHATTEAFAFFDWRQFDDDTRFLEDVEILTEERAPTEICATGATAQLWPHEIRQPSADALSHGTLLRMSSLRQGWGTKEFDELTRGLSRLVAPAQQKNAAGSEFEIFLELPQELSEYSKKIAPPAILGHPHYLIQGSVNTDGSYQIAYSILNSGEVSKIEGRFVRVLTTKNRYEFRAIDASEPAPPKDVLTLACGALTFELRVWDRDELGNVVQKTQSTIRDIRRDLDSVAGINLYRDGFRVLPYGEPRDDWLRLDLRRVQNPTLRLSNNQIHGVVSITADGNPNLKDQSNREGLDENQAVSDLRDVLTETLARLEQLRYAARPRAGSTSNKPAGGLFTPFDLSQLEKHLSQASPTDKTALAILDRAEKAFDGQLKEIQTVLSRYQRLATLGQLIDHMLHEGRQPIAAINNEAFLGLKDATKLQSSSPVEGEKLTTRFSKIRKHGDILAIAFRRMEPFGGRRRGRPTQLYLEEIIKDAFDVFEEDIKKLGVKTDLPTTQTLVRVDPAEVQEIVINLLQNSLHWLQQVEKSVRSILITVHRHDAENLDIYFSDSGPGVSKENRELIFEPYFSTRVEGVGLGLVIVGEIVSDYYGGALQLLEEGPLSGANFLITLRKRV